MGKQQADELQRKISELNSRNQELERAIRELHQKNWDSEAKLRNLHQIIINSGQKNAPPMDDEVTSGFLKLRYQIMHTVKSHYTNPKAKIRSSVYESLNSENKELYVRGRMAKLLYDYFFGPKILIFGAGDEWESGFATFEECLVIEKGTECTPTHLAY